MSDTNPTQPLPDPAAQWVLSSPQPPRKKRWWPWLIAAIAVVGLMIGAWFAGEYIARGIVHKTIRDQIITQLSLPADQQIDIDLPGAVLPQLIAGEFDALTVSSEDVAFGDLSGDIEVHATGVPVRGDTAVDSASATVTLDEDQVRALLGTIDGFPADTVTLDAPDIAVEFELQLFALTIPVGVALTPSAEAGKLVLTPASLRVADAEISADALLRQFGAIASTVVRDWDVCIAEYLPAGLTLTGVEVQADTVVVDFDIDGAIATDPQLRENGTCA